MKNYIGFVNDHSGSMTKSFETRWEARDYARNIGRKLQDNGVGTAGNRWFV